MSDSPEPHPLDEALRRRLSGYAEAPGPQVWAGVRAQLPGPSRAAPVPHWRRPARRLGMLLGVLAGLWLLVGPLRSALVRLRSAHTASGQSGRNARPGAPAQKLRRPKEALVFEPGRRPFRPDFLPPSGRPTPPAPVAGAAPPAAGRPAVAALATPAPPTETPRRPALPIRRARRSATASPAVSPFPAKQALAATLSRRPAGRPMLGPTPPPRPNATPPSRSAARYRPGAAAGSRAALISSPQAAGPQVAARAETGAAALALSLPVDAASPAARTPVAELPFKTSTAPAGRPAALPAPLAAQPDSLFPTPPAAARRRRWAVQAVAGPTLSYRRLFQPPRSGLAEAAQRERPGLGWGAQAQVRRVLSGRWALAAGVGFQQYATRPGVTQSSASTGYYSGPAAVTPQRDTYNLLVAPVQLSYALGSFGPRWQLAVMGGVEPGRYLGGRATVSSAVNNGAIPSPSTNPATGLPVSNAAADFTQRTYADASASPYRPWNLGLSLGVEVRYRLAPASPWQLLVQPTARGLVSPFAKTSAADYSRRPVSLGVLAGLSWDLIFNE